MPEEEIAASICLPPLVEFGFYRRAPDKTGGEVREWTPFRDATPQLTDIVRMAFFFKLRTRLQ